MIYTPDNITAIIEGRKWNTRRVCKPGERLFFSDDTNQWIVYANNRLKWMTGRDYAVQPGRGQPGAWWHPADLGGPAAWGMPNQYVFVMDHSWRPLRIRLLSIRRERVQDISEADAIAEGCVGYEEYNTRPRLWEIERYISPIEDYARVWDSINARKGTRWTDNPECWCLSFEVVK